MWWICRNLEASKFPGNGELDGLGVWLKFLVCTPKFLTSFGKGTRFQMLFRNILLVSNHSLGGLVFQVSIPSMERICSTFLLIILDDFCRWACTLISFWYFPQKYFFLDMGFNKACCWIIYLFEGGLFIFLSCMVFAFLLVVGTLL